MPLKKNENYENRRSISYDLIIALLSTVIVSSLLIISIFYWYLNRNNNIVLTRTGETYIAHLKNSLEGPVWALNKNTISQICDPYMNTKLVVKLKVLDLSDNTVLYEHEIPDRGKLMKMEGYVKHNDENIAYIQMEFSRSTAERDIFRTLQLIVILIVMIVLIIIGVSLITIRYLLQAPLQVLLFGIGKIASGMYDYRFKPSRYVEFFAITKKFEEMARQIKERESLLQKSEKRYQTIMESMKEPLYICSQDLIIQYMNPAMIKRTGHDATGEICFKAIHDLDQRCPWCHHEDIMCGNVFECDVVSPKDNHEFHISITPFVNDDRSISSLNVCRDVTEFKKLESRLLQSQKMESIGTLAGGIAHDFNNLLYPIIGFSEMLKEDLPPDSPEHESAQEIFNAGRRGGELVKQILAFSRQAEHTLSPVRFQKILKEVCKLTRSTIPSDIEIHLDIQNDCGLVMAEATQLHQIAMNLVTNAYHAVEKVSGEISIQLKEIILDNDDLKDSPLQPGQYVMLSVSDNGVGIPKEIMKNIFEPYFTTKKKGKGTGLGLAVVYGILTEHKGDIKVYSEVGKGTTFNVYLPLMKKPDEAISTEKVLNKLTGTERILLVDDEESVVRLEKQMLERLGYTVSARSKSLEALETFNSNPNGYDLVISDMTMPNMTGDQLAQELMSIRPDIPIIICTGFSERINKEQAEANKAKGFLMKPVVKSEMAQMVRKVLDETKIS